MSKTAKVVQGTYISLEAKKALLAEAKRRDIFVTTLASEILEKEARRFAKKEKMDQLLKGD